MIIKYLHYILLIFLWVSLFKPTLHSQKNQISNYQSSLTAFISRPNLKQAKISALIFDLNCQDTLASYKSHQSLTPASIQKLVTTATALSVLQKDYRYKTQVLYTGHINQGTLHGDIIIKGFGDPTLGSVEFEETTPFDLLIDQFVNDIKLAGIHAIEGNIVADASYFDADPVPTTWQKEDIGNYYGAGVWGLNIRDNYYHLHFLQKVQTGTPSKVLKTTPTMIGLEIDNRVKMGTLSSGDQAYIYGEPFKNSIYIKGTIPRASQANQTFSIKGSIPEPPYWLSIWLKQKLSQAQIQIKGQSTVQYQDIYSINNTSKIAEYYSPSLDKIIHQTNHQSVNLYAEVLLRSISKYQGHNSNNSTSSIVLKGLWEPSSFINWQLHDGSGLSKKNKLSPELIIKVLNDIYLDPLCRNTYLVSLPQAGHGTLKSMFLNARNGSNIHAKSGSMRGVRSYAGYMDAKNGHKLAFCIIVNDYSGPSSLVKSQLNKLIETWSMF